METWPTFHDLMAAYKSCRLHKPASRSQVQFEMRLGSNLSLLHNEIRAERYQPLPSQCFVVTQPKPREIFAAHFRDRIVHHLVVSQLEPFWEKRLITSTFACRIGKGTHGAMRHAQDQVRRISQGGHRTVWALQVDIAKYFVTIHRPTLSSLLLAPIRNPRLKHLVHLIYQHDARVGAKRSGNPAAFDLIPQGKSWFDQDPDRGIAIGNLSSQFGANVYLSGLDHWIQRQLKPMAYLRYMDDGLLLDTDPKKLELMPDQIDHWLGAHRSQHLNPHKTHLRPLPHGIDYLGYHLRQVDSASEPLQIFAEPLKKWKFIRSLRRLEKAHFAEATKPHHLAPFLPDRQMKRSLASLNSRLGVFHHCRSYLFREKALNRLIKSKTLLQDIPPQLADPWCPLTLKRDYRAIRLK